MHNTSLRSLIREWLSSFPRTQFGLDKVSVRSYCSPVLTMRQPLLRGAVAAADDSSNGQMGDSPGVQKNVRPFGERSAPKGCCVIEPPRVTSRSRPNPTTQRGIMAAPFPALLRSRGRPSPLHRTRGKGSALPTDPTARGGPPPLLGLSPGLCGPGGTVAYFTHRTVTGILGIHSED